MVNEKKLIEMIYIYQSGYYTHSKHTLQEWFEAREYCNKNYTAMRKFTRRVSDNIPSPRI